MISINIVCVGNLKEDYFVKAVKEYQKRLGAFVKLNIVEVKESFLPNNATIEQIKKAKQEEAKHLLQKAKGYTIALEIDGKTFSSEAFSQKFNQLTVEGNSEFTFFIGGSNGLDDELSRNANLQLSFSQFTFPHQLMRVILLEQIYRAMCILNNKTYHK
jgi:23S rRNA (pseudouridine1915-N3)-methyltransferase